MPARDPFSTADEQRIRATLPSFSRRDQALILLGLHSGFRARELGALTVGHVASETGPIRDKVVLERRHLKNGRGAYRERIRSRAVPLTATARLALDEYVQERRAAGSAQPDAPLFRSRKGQGLSIWQINRVVHAVADRAGCSADRLFGSHSLRKSFAQRVHAASGRDINLTRVALGHSSVAITQRYLRVDQADVDAAIMALDTARVA